MSSYKIVYAPGEGEIEEKKSRFIAHVRPISSEEEALEFIAAMKKQHWDARHNCYAYTLGRNNELQRCSDDGEPAQTAGRPMLEVINREGIHNCVVVVTRYFGGTLLGTGGLVRAYQKSTQEGLADATIATVMDAVPVTIVSDYTLVGKLQYIIATGERIVSDTRYAENVETDLMIPAEELEAFVKEINDATNAAVELVIGDKTEYTAV